LSGNVFKFPVAPVEVKLVFDLISGKKQVLISILVKIGDGYSPTIVDVLIGKDVK
jgi:hypothetical protein